MPLLALAARYLTELAGVPIRSRDYGLAPASKARRMARTANSALWTGVVFADEGFAHLSGLCPKVPLQPGKACRRPDEETAFRTVSSRTG